MACIVYDFHTIPEANKRWADMERFQELRRLGLVPSLPASIATRDLHFPISSVLAESNMPSDVDPFDVAFFAPLDDPA